MLKDNRKYSNEEIAEFLTNIATAYEIKNKGFFRIVSYQNAADSVAAYTKPLQEIWSQDPQKLTEVPNLGENIIKKIDYLFRHNKFHPAVIRAFNKIHPVVFTFTKVNGIGPKTAHKLTQNLEFSKDPAKALEQLVDYAKKGQIRDLERMGEKSEESILINTLNFMGRKEKMSLAQARETATAVINFMQQKFPSVIFMPLGSLRRQSPQVGDIDIAAQSDKAADILDYFVTYPDSIQTIARGPKKASLRLRHDIRVDLMVQPKETWGSLLQHFTGSKQHNIDLRRYALELGYSLSEYGIKDIRTAKLFTFDNEKDFYNFLKLNYIPPENRTGENEIQNAKK